MFAVPSPRVAAEGSLKPHGPEPCGVTQVVQLPALHALDDRLCWPDCHSWAPCSGISVVPTGSADRHQILITLSNGLIFILQESWVNDIPSSTSENPPLKLDAQHSLQLTLDYRAKFRSIGLGSLNSNSKPNSSTSGMHPITKQNVMKTFGSSVLSTFHHIAPNGVQMLKVQPEVSESSGFGCLMSWLYECVSNLQCLAAVRFSQKLKTIDHFMSSSTPLDQILVFFSFLFFFLKGRCP